MDTLDKDLSWQRTTWQSQTLEVEATQDCIPGFKGLLALPRASLVQPPSISPQLWTRWSEIKLADLSRLTVLTILTTVLTALADDNDDV